MRALIFSLLLCLPVAAQVPPVWTPPAGWEVLGDVPAIGGSRSGYAIDEAGWLWSTAYINADFRSYDFHRLNLSAPLPGRWVQIPKGLVSFVPDKAPLFFSHPDTVLIAGQGIRRTVNGGSSWQRVSTLIPPRLLYRGVSPRGLSERIFALNGGSDLVHASDDRGQTWTPLPWPGISTRDGFSDYTAASYPTEAGPWGDATTLPLGRYVFGSNYGVVLSDDNGATASQSSLFGQGLTIDQITVLARPEGGLRIVAFGSINGGGCGCSRVWTSDDHGATFVQRALLNDPTSPNSNTAVALLPQVRRSDGSLWIAGPTQATPSWQTSEAVVVLTTGIVYSTRDGGLTWAQAAAPYDRIPFESPVSLVFSALMDSAGRLYPMVLEYNVQGGDTQTWAIRSTGAYPVASTAPPVPDLSGVEVTVVPNPTTGRVALSLFLPEASTVGAEVYDALGRRVATVAATEHAAGAGTLALDASGLAPGVYVARVTVGSAPPVVRRFVVAR